MAARTSPRRMPERIPIEERPVLFPDEVCQQLAISVDKLRCLVKAGVIHRVGIGKPVRYAKSEIARVLGEVPEPPAWEPGAGLRAVK